MTNINDSLQHDIITIINITRTATRLYNDILSFKELDDFESNLLSQKYKFLTRIYFSLYIYLVLEITKLYDKKGAYSLSKILNFCIVNFEKINWANKIDIQQLKNLEMCVVASQSSNIFKEIKTARDKYYAHLDKNRPSDLQINFKELSHLLKDAQNIIKFLNSHITDTQFIFETEDSDMAGGLYNLIKYQELYNEVFNTYKEHPNAKIESKKLVNLFRKTKK